MPYGAATQPDFISLRSSRPRPHDLGRAPEQVAQPAQQNGYRPPSWVEHFSPVPDSVIES
jgi:hypothetical protein